MIWRKLIYFCMCLLLYVNLCRSENHVANEDLQTILDSHLESVNNQLTSLLDQSSFTTDMETDIEFYTPKTDILPHPYSTANIFTLFNNTYVLMDKTLYYVIPSNDTVALKKHEEFARIDKIVSFIRTIEYNNFGMVFIALPTGHCLIYGYSNNQWFFIQSIQNTGRASDARFFVNENKLYLIITNTEGDALTPSSIYHWTETHFDEIDKVLTRNAVAVLSFNTEKSEVIIILQNSPNHHKHNLIAYELHNEHLRKKQLLLANNSQHVISYQFKSYQYLVIFEETQNSTLYWWDGSEFVPWMKFENYTQIQRSLLATIDEIPVIFLVQKDRLLVFGHLSQYLRLISKTKINEKYEKILDMQIISRNDTRMVLVLILTSENQLKSMVIPFSVNFHRKARKPAETDVLLQCLANLGKNIEISNLKLDSITESSQKMIQTNEPLEYKGRMNVGAAVRADSANVISQITSTPFQHQANELQDRLNSVIDRTNILNPKVDTLFHEGDSVHGNMIVKGALHAEQLWANDIHVETLNGVPWTPDMWLSYSKPQTISGTVLCKELNTKQLDVSPINKVFNDFAFQTQSVENLSIINSLRANNIYVKKINDIPFEDVYLRTQPVTIQGVKKFDKLSIDKMQVDQLNDKAIAEAIVELHDITRGGVLFSPNLNIKNFNFERINDIHWNIFKDSVFRIGTTTKITGTLTGPAIKAKQLFAKALSKMDADALLTTTTDQIVTSTLQFANIHAQNVVSNKINNINLRQQAATSENNIINGLVSINNMQVNGNLHIEGAAFSVPVGEEHVIGTSESDLLQIYNNKVKIIGNLHLSNVHVSDMAKVIVNNEEFDQNLNTSYWLKSQNQVIPTHFEALKGMSIPHLTTSVLNNFPVASYLTNDLEDKLPTTLLFENVTILGNVTIDPDLLHTPDLKRIDSESVKITGSYHITGHTALQGKISIGNLITNYLDEVRVSDVLSSSYSGQILGTKTFENLIIAENIASNSIMTNILNDVDLDILKNEALYLDQPVDIEKLRFNEVIAQDISTSNINNHEFHKHLTHMDGVYTMRTLNNVTVHGNVRIKSAHQVTHINDHAINDLLTNVLRHDGNIILENDVRFLGRVYAENVEVKYVNNVNFPNLVERLLYKYWDQNITADYTFEKLNAPNIYVPEINDIITEYLINTKNPNPQDLLVWGGLQLFAPIFLKSLNSETSLCNLNDAVLTLKNPPTRYWNVVHVAQNISVWDDYSDLNLILKKAVNSNRNNLIEAPVVFQHHISANTVYLQKLINGVDINEIFTDAVLKTATEPQIITGRKRFGHFAAANVLVNGNADIPIVNDIDIENLDQSILDRNNIHTTVIKGPKVFFGGLQANRLVTARISDLDPLDLINLADVLVIPRTAFHSLQVDNNLDIEYVNTLDMRAILRDRLFRYHHEEQAAYGTYYFAETAYLMGESNISKINDLPVDDIVIDVGTQTIRSPKTFMQPVLVNGDISVGFLNGRNVSESYKQAILLGESNTIKGNIKFNNASSITGDITTNSINGVPMNFVNEFIHSKVPVIQHEIITNITDEMANIIKRSSEMSADMPHVYLYLEKSTEIQIPIENARSAYAYERNQTVMLEVIQEEQGPSCGLPDYCSCPVQNTIQITPQLSINPILKSSNQRSFVYDNEGIIVQLFTTTVSTSESCRANASTAFDELTTMSLMVTHENESKPVFFVEDKYVGYVSGVEFFHHNTHSYMVVSRFYDPINNTHNLHCIVYKFIKETGTILDIQKIPCNGAWTLHLFHTAQGITLVIGSTFHSDEVDQGTGAEIYRFDPETEQFMLLRRVRSTGCNAATGVVIGPDSLIILAHKTSLQIFKYHPVYDNYYFYQSIFLDSPVVGISAFYIAGFGISDAYLCVVTDSGDFYIYSFQYIRGWQIVSSGEIEGLQSLVPFELNRKLYLFAVSTKVSYILSVIKQGSS